MLVLLPYRGWQVTLVVRCRLTGNMIDIKLAVCACVFLQFALSGPGQTPTTSSAVGHLINASIHCFPHQLVSAK